MYESFYGLSCKPFQLNPDPAFYFSSRQHRRAKAYLEYGVQRNEGFIVITGEVGAGKTTIVRGLLESLDADKVVAASLVTTQLDAEDTLKMVGSAFGVLVKDASKSDVLMALEAFFVTQTSQGKRCLLVVDEAQNLTPSVVEELRMLSNFQLGQQALLQTFLVGQPEFRAILQSPGMQQLKQRVTATCHIGPLDPEETKGYVLHRLKCAGSEGRPTFDDAAFEVIHRLSGGIPRRINQIADRLLLLGFLGNKYAFCQEDVNEVQRDFQDEVSVPGGTRQGSQLQLDDGARLSAVPLDIDLAKLHITAAGAGAISTQVDRLAGEQYDDRLRRMEVSVLRLERIGLETLLMLQKLVRSATKGSEENLQ
jgi:putative secretion ATPase (PEP-CTERM system associated)